jgi:hypothetical protein
MPTIGVQESLLLDPPEESHDTTKEPLAIAASTEVFGGSDGHPEGEARAETAKEDQC